MNSLRFKRWGKGSQRRSRPDPTNTHDGPGAPPDSMSYSEQTVPLEAPRLRTGAWILTLTPTEQINGNATIFDGTLRIAAKEGGFTVSADIYQREDGAQGDSAVRLHPPSPIEGIPIFKRSQYRAYWLVKNLTAENDKFYMDYQVWRWNTSMEDWLSDAQNATLEFTLDTVASASGKTFNSNNEVDNIFEMNWTCSNFRKICIEIDTVGGLEDPLEAGQGNHTWDSALAGVADYKLIRSD